MLGVTISTYPMSLNPRVIEKQALDSLGVSRIEHRSVYTSRAHTASLAQNQADDAVCRLNESWRLGEILNFKANVRKVYSKERDAIW